MSKLLLLLSILSVPLFTAASADAVNKKVFVPSFSHTQTTEKVALEIQKKTGADLFRIETVQAYPTIHKEATEFAEKKRNADARPALKNTGVFYEY